MALRWGGKRANSVNTDKGGNPANDDAPDRPAVPISRVAGPVFPYRGQEQHGVAVTQAPYVLGADVYDYDVPEYMEAIDEQEPIAVRVVEADSREVRGFAATQTIVDSITRIIAGANERRRSVKVRNMDAVKRIYIGHDLTLSVGTGYPIEPTATVELLNVETAVYGISADGTQVIVAILQERTVAND